MANTLQRVYFGNWLRDYSQVCYLQEVASKDAEQYRLLILQLSAKSK